MAHRMGTGARGAVLAQPANGRRLLQPAPYCRSELNVTNRTRGGKGDAGRAGTCEGGSSRALIPGRPRAMRGIDASVPGGQGDPSHNLDFHEAHYRSYRDPAFAGRFSQLRKKLPAISRCRDRRVFVEKQRFVALRQTPERGTELGEPVTHDLDQRASRAKPTRRTCMVPRGKQARAKQTVFACFHRAPKIELV